MEQVKRIIFVFLSLSMLVLCSFGTSADENEEIFYSFSKETTYEDIMNLYKDQIDYRDEEEIVIDDIEILGDYKGELTLYFEDGELTSCHSFIKPDWYDSENLDEEKYYEWNILNILKLVDYYNE